MKFVGKRVDLEIITLSEIIQTQKKTTASFLYYLDSRF